MFAVQFVQPLDLLLVRCEIQVLGVTTINAGLLSSSYYLLAADPQVFLIDVTPAFAEHHLLQQHASLLNANDLVVTAAYPVYWYLESSRLSP